MWKLGHLNHIEFSDMPIYILENISTISLTLSSFIYALSASLVLSYLQYVVAEPNKVANYNPRSDRYLAMDLETS